MKEKEAIEGKEANMIKWEKQAWGLYESKETKDANETKEVKKAEQTEWQNGYRSCIYRSYLALLLKWFDLFSKLIDIFCNQTILD